MKKYTLIGNYSFQSGSHTHTITNLYRCLTDDLDSVFEYMQNERGVNVIYIIEGHPTIEGEHEYKPGFPLITIEKKKT